MAPPEFVTWLPITDEERQLKASIVEKDAGAEVLLWRVRVVDELLGSNRDLQRVFYHYLRLKVFDEKGKEASSTVDLPYREPGAILDVSGRTIKADGRVLELDKKTIYKRDLVRAGGLRQKAVSFAMPAVEPGAIIEYRWKQTEDDSRFRYLRLHFQRDIPVEKVTYFVKPLSREIAPGEQMFLAHFNCETSPLKQENDGYSSVSVMNVPASHDEPYAPSDPNLEAWALLYYRQGGLKEPEKYWDQEGKKVYHELKDTLKANDEIKKTAAEAVSGAKTDDEKLTALIVYLRKHLRNLSDPDVTTAERQSFIEKLPRNRSRNASEILQSGIATSDEMNSAFAALALQAGFDVRPALVADRDELSFNPKGMTDRFFIDDVAIAVKLSNAWKLLDVSRKYLFPGMLPWREEGVFALVSDPKTPAFIETPISKPEASVELRTAHLTLSTDGSLEGDVEEAYSGHRAEDYRGSIARQSEAQREEWLRDRVTRMFPDAEVSAIQLEGVEDGTKHLRVTYHMKAPQYAQITGKRIFFQPIAFRRSQGSPFTAKERRYQVNFPYAWKEIDQIHIVLPEGFALDNPVPPGDLEFGKPGSYHTRMTITYDKNPDLFTTREFTFGDQGILTFPQASYGALKRAFDEVQARDGQSISLKGN